MENLFISIPEWNTIIAWKIFHYEQKAQDSDDDFASLLDSGTPQKPSPGDDLQRILAEASPGGIQTIDLRGASPSPLKDIERPASFTSPVKGILDQPPPFTPGSIPSSPQLSPDNVKFFP